MTTNDIKVISLPASTREFKVDDRNTSTVARTIKAGEPVVECTNFVARIKDDDPEIDVANEVLVGIATSESTESATVNGTVLVTMLFPCVTVLRGVATTTSNVNSESNLLAYLNDVVQFGASYTPYDSSNEGVITIDESDEDSTAHGLIIIGGSGDARGELDVIVKNRNLLGGNIA